MLGREGLGTNEDGPSIEELFELTLDGNGDCDRSGAERGG